MVDRKRTSINIDGSLPDVVSGLGVKNFSRYVEDLIRRDVKRLEGVSEIVEDDLDKVGLKLEKLSGEWSRLWSEREKDGE